MEILCHYICLTCDLIYEIYCSLKDPLFSYTVFLFLVTAYYLYYKLYKCVPLTLSYEHTPLNDFIADSAPELTKIYCPTPYLLNGNLQTVFYAIKRHFINCRFGIAYNREMLPLSDGGQLAMDWPVFEEVDSNMTVKTPIIAILPGLTGGRKDIYVANVIIDGAKRGFKTVLINHRGCSNTKILVLDS